MQCGTEMVASQFVSEISSPLLHLREMLKEFGVRDTGLNLLVDVLFALTFSVARMGFGPYLTYSTVTADNPILIKVRIRWPNQPSSQQPPPPKSQQTLTHGMLCCVRFDRQAMATGLQLVSAYWFLRILRMVRYKLGKNKKKPPPPPPSTAGKLATD